MIKKIVLLLLSVFLLAYLLFAILFVNPNIGNDTCKNIEVVVMDTLDRHYIENKDIAEILKNVGLNPIGKNMKNIHTETIEKKLEENGLIKKAECYKTSGGNLKIEIYQKIPILRVFSSSGSYYIDNEGRVMPLPPNFAVYVPIATGSIEKDFATTKLYNFVLFLHNNKFWDNQIEQIYVAPNLDIELTPRVGNHQILLGKLDFFEENLEKLRIFYEKGLNEVGWNKYSYINLKYKNQVVCTKKK